MKDIVGPMERYEERVTVFLNRLASSSKKAYLINLNQWSLWCKVHSADPMGGEGVVLAAQWLASLALEARAPATIAHKITSLRAIYRWLIDTGAVSCVNPFSESFCPAPNADNKRTRGSKRLSDEKMREIFDLLSSDQSERGRMFHLAFVLISELALRRSELTRIRRADIADDLTTVTLRGTKSGRDFTVATTPAVRQLLAQALSDLTVDYVYPMSISSLVNKWNEITAAVGVVNVSLHSIRATSITRFYDRTKDIELTRLFARHTNVDCTLRYVRVDKGKVGEVMQGLTWG